MDEDLFLFLNQWLPDAVVADCGCGPGIVTEKFLKKGAHKVYAIDVNQAMLHQVKNRLSCYIDQGQLEVIHRPFTPGLFSDLVDHQPRDAPNIVLFKRSLYDRPQQTKKVLAAAYASLAPGGVLAVIHPERSLRRYAFGPRLQIKPYTGYHLFNRVISTLADWFRIKRYTLYDQTGLKNLLQSALPQARVSAIPTQQSAFNLVAAVDDHRL